MEEQGDFAKVKEKPAPAFGRADFLSQWDGGFESHVHYSHY